jgi:integrase
MYTLIPPVRADYFALEIIRDDQDPVEPNYLRIRRGEMETVLRDFKTAKTYHQIRNVLPDTLAQEIHASLLQSPRQFLFVNAHGRPHTRNSFTLWTRRILTRVLHSDFTLVFFRHAFATHFVSHHYPTDLDISEVSKKMGHSSEMFRAYRWVTAGPAGDAAGDAAGDQGESEED